MTSHSAMYKVDENGCSHNDPGNWQMESDLKYYKEYRRTEERKGNKVLSLQCMNCKRDMRELLGIVVN